MSEYTTEFAVVQENEAYKEVDLYVTSDSGEQWYVRIYLKRNTNAIVKCDARYAVTEDSDFDDGTSYFPYPIEVYDAVYEALPAVELMLRTYN